MPTEYFRSKEAYRKNLAYRHINDIPFTAREVVVAGKRHKVKHSGREIDRVAKKRRAEGKRETPRRRGR